MRVAHGKSRSLWLLDRRRDSTGGHRAQLHAVRGERGQVVAADLVEPRAGRAMQPYLGQRRHPGLPRHRRAQLAAPGTPLLPRQLLLPERPSAPRLGRP